MTQLITGFAIFLFGLTLESITSWRAIRGARKHHPVLWEHSGRPTLMGNGDLFSAWPLVKYYRDRLYLEEIDDGDETLPPIVSPPALAFAERLRAPLLYTYYFALICVLVALLLVFTASM